MSIVTKGLGGNQIITKGFGVVARKTNYTGGLDGYWAQRKRYEQEQIETQRIEARKILEQLEVAATAEVEVQGREILNQEIAFEQEVERLQAEINAQYRFETELRRQSQIRVQRAREKELAEIMMLLLTEV